MPEIALTAHLLETYRARFGDEVAILHSHLSIGERYDEWRRIEGGEAKVVIGARSAIFAPVRDLGIIVVDEEHEPSYKQERELRYNARTIAEELARRASASVVLEVQRLRLRHFTGRNQARLALRFCRTELIAVRFPTL